ncbi:MAG: hypothetical protein ACHBNF_15970 [Chromatiales bacterium]
MANSPSANGKCRQKQVDAMKKGQPLGLDELMIVNPGPPGTETLFLGEDGSLYQAQGLGEKAEPQGTGQFLLGEDGTLYQVQGLGSNGAAEEATVGTLGEAQRRELGRFFLGEDGTLYERVR